MLSAFPAWARVLLFEGAWWRRAGSKDDAIRATFRCSPVAYYQRLNRLLDDPAAMAAQPLLVARLRRQRDWARHYPGAARARNG